MPIQEEEFKAIIWRPVVQANDATEEGKVPAIDTDNDTDNDTDIDTDNDTDKRLAKIIQNIETNSNITTRQLSKLCSVSQSTIKRDIDKLKTQNKIIRVGTEKGGHWEIMK